MSGTYRAPEVSSERITSEFVRDELLRCFESANREFLTLLRQPVADEALKTQVKQFVEGVFQNCGVSYVHPTIGLTMRLGFSAMWTISLRTGNLGGA